jgi:hypothetical protein
LFDVFEHFAQLCRILRFFSGSESDAGKFRDAVNVEVRRVGHY